MNDNPCFGCRPPKRNADCHSICKEYTDWKRDHDAELDRQRQKKLQDWGMIDIRESSIRKAKRKKKKVAYEAAFSATVAQLAREKGHRNP